MLKQLRKKLPKRWQQSAVWEKPARDSQQRLAFDQKLVWEQTRTRRIPQLSQLKYISSFFSARERFAILAAALSIFCSAGIAAFFVYLRYVEPQPAYGGAYREAVVGAPLYVNPILATTNDVDLDLAHLMFSGLLRYDQDLSLKPDLAEDWALSEDQKTYTVTLRKDAIWHDGEPVTVDDVLYTFRLIQDPVVNSPLRASVQGVLITAPDDHTLQFVLEKPFRPFASVLTTGILPQHVWENIPASTIRLAELNIKPIGSGPWLFEKLEKDRQGNIYSYTMQSFEYYYGERPYLESLTVRFFTDFDSAVEALNSNKVDGMSFVPRQLVANISNIQQYQTYHLQLPQYTALFFNDNKNAALKDKTVRQAIAYSFDRQRLVEEALDGLGQIINGPLLPGMDGYDPELEGYPYNPVEAQRLLEEAGWKSITAQEYVDFQTEVIRKEREKAAKEAADKAEAAQAVAEATEDEADDAAVPEPALEEDEIVVDTGNQAAFRKKGEQILEIKLTAVNQPENIRAAELLKNALQTIGFKVDLEIVSVSTLTNIILPERSYEALLYGHILNVIPHLYAFWHSSQIEYPGLNLAGFADKDSDKLLEKARETAKIEDVVEAHKQFQKNLDKETSAVFLYSPKYTYLLPAKMKGFDIERISIPSDRWNNIEQWYVKTKRGWKKP
jgi:ABC-type transport system substrate-binding protein